jgi:hypothetical protein
MSWVLMNLDGSMVPIKDNKQQRREVLTVVKETLWASDSLHQLCIRVIARARMSVTPPAFKAFILNSLELTYIFMQDLEGHPKPLYQLTGRPISNSHVDQNDYIACLKKHKFKLNGAPISTGREMSCTQCKSDRHPTHLCPFPDFDDWNGKKKDPEAEQPNSSATPMPRRNAGSRGRGGKRGRGKARGGHIPAATGNPNRYSNLTVFDT